MLCVVVKVIFSTSDVLFGQTCEAYIINNGCIPFGGTGRALRLSHLIHCHICMKWNVIIVTAVLFLM